MISPGLRKRCPTRRSLDGATQSIRTIIKAYDRTTQRKTQTRLQRFELHRLYLPCGDLAATLAAFVPPTPSQYPEEASAASLPRLNTTEKQHKNRITITNTIRNTIANTITNA